MNDATLHPEWIKYVAELRSRLLKCLGVTVIIFLLLFPFAQPIYHGLTVPLLNQLPQGMTLIATRITATFFVPVKLAGLLSLCCAMPYFLYQSWLFLRPALYQHERQWFWWILSSSIILFYGGILFCYQLIFPLLFKFLIQAAPAGVNILPDISDYLDFSLQLFLAFGLIFQVPLFVILLILLEIMSVDNLVRKRPYIIVGAFIIAMILAPPDVLSQIVLAIPLWLLFELGVLIARWLMRYRK